MKFTEGSASPASLGRPMLARDLQILLIAASLGGIAAALAIPIFGHFLNVGAARDGAIAIGAAVSSTTHGRLAHGYPWRSVGLSIALGAPLVYGVMQAIHWIVLP